MNNNTKEMENNVNKLNAPARHQREIQTDFIREKIIGVTDIISVTNIISVTDMISVTLLRVTDIISVTPSSDMIYIGCRILSLVYNKS